jgi:hypothetical protein
MLVELAAANAAFAVIKEAVQNSGEIMSAGKAVMDWFTAKNELQKKIEEKPESERNDLEEFFALEEMKQKEQELKDLMIIQGRPGLWQDWCKFQQQARHKREAAKAAEIRKKLQEEADRDHLIEKLLLWFWMTVLMGFLVLMIVGTIWFIITKGKF